MAAASMLAVILCSALVLGGAARVTSDLVGGKQVTFVAYNRTERCAKRLDSSAYARPGTVPAQALQAVAAIYVWGGLAACSCARVCIPYWLAHVAVPIP